MSFLIEFGCFAAGLIAFLIWGTIIVPMLIRPFGYELPMGPRRKSDRSQEWQVVPFVLIIGVLRWGWGFLFYSTVRDYFLWQFRSAEKPSISKFLIGFIIWTLFGALIGYSLHKRP